MNLCRNTSLCEGEICINTPGSFICTTSCPQGHVVNGEECEGI